MEKTKRVYLLVSNNIANILGVFSALDKVKLCVRKLPKSEQYKVYSIPMDRKLMQKGTALSTGVERYLCHYFGTFEEYSLHPDKKCGKMREVKRQVIFWP